MYKVFIDGKEGTTGLRIYERLAERDDVELLLIGEALRKDTAARTEFINASDVTFLCLPDAAAVEAVSLVHNDHTKIIDASTAHRTAEGWAYGFPELGPDFKRAIETNRLIANPGCHASGFISLIYPLIKAEIIGSDYPLSCFSLTGYSGGGKKMIAEYESESKGMELFSARHYGLAQNHKHLPEMKAVCGLDREPIFFPVVDDFYSGMLANIPLFPHLMKKKLDGAQLTEIYMRAYEDQPLMKVLPYTGENGYMGSNNLEGMDSMEIMVEGNSDRLCIMSRFDNLGKGASGAAVQCMNLALGAPETAGLVF